MSGLRPTSPIRMALFVVRASSVLRSGDGAGPKACSDGASLPHRRQDAGMSEPPPPPRGGMEKRNDRETRWVRTTRSGLPLSPRPCCAWYPKEFDPVQGATTMSTKWILTVMTLAYAITLPSHGFAQEEPIGFFITSVGSGNGGDLGGPDGADAHCEALAEAAGAGDRTWRAYLSTQASGGQPAVNARDRIGEGPWFQRRRPPDRGQRRRSALQQCRNQL